MGIWDDIPCVWKLRSEPIRQHTVAAPDPNLLIAHRN